ncbi:glutathione S-transferase, partial [Aureobasidium melanogenum]
MDANQNNDPTKKTYHKKATGKALETVEKHSQDHELKLFGSCFCAVQVDPYKKPQQLLEVNPRGLVPALRHGNWGCYESTVLMEYVETAPILRKPTCTDKNLASSKTYRRVNRHIVPGFYRYLQAQEEKTQIENGEELKEQISKLVDAADKSGPFFLGDKMTFVDVQMAPWVIRLRKVLQPYRGWPEPESGTRWAAWVNAIEQNHAVRATTSTDTLYQESYQRYAENRPNTSQVQQAINSGRGLP